MHIVWRGVAQRHFVWLLDRKRYAKGVHNGQRIFQNDEIRSRKFDFNYFEWIDSWCNYSLPLYEL